MDDPILPNGHRMAEMSFAAGVFIVCRDYLLTGFNEAQ